MIAHIFQDQPWSVGGIHSKPVSIYEFWVMRSQNLQVFHVKSQQNHHEITVLKSKNIIFPSFLTYTGELMIIG